MLLLRSRIFLFLEKYDSALIDAQRCVRLSRRNPFVYLHLARAHAAVGDFESAKITIATAKLLADTSLHDVLDEVDELNSYMLAIQSYMKQQGSRLTVCLDPYYRKRLYPTHSFSTNEAMFCDDKPIISLTSFFSEPPANRCSFCYAPVKVICSTNEVSENKNHLQHTEKATVNEPSREEECLTELTHHRENTTELTFDKFTTSANINKSTINRTNFTENINDNNDARSNNNVDNKEAIQASSTSVMEKKASKYLFCSSSNCSHKGTCLLELMQMHKDGITRARELIYSKAAVTIDRYPLEMGAMTIRLFFYVIAESTQMMKEQCVVSEQEQYTSLKEILKHLNVYPMVTEIISSRLRDEIGAVYDALTVNFTPKHKALYSIELFAYLYRYVRAYFISVQVEELNSEQNKGNTNNNEIDVNDDNNNNSSKQNENTNNISLMNTIIDDNLDNSKIGKEEFPETLDITRVANTSNTNKKSRMDLVFPLFANDNKNRYSKLTLFCLPTIIGGVERACVTSCFGSGHVEIRHLAAIASLSKSQLSVNKSPNIATDNNNTYNNNKNDCNMGRSYNSNCSNNNTNNGNNNGDDIICFASAPPNCEIHARFTSTSNIDYPSNIMQKSLINKYFDKEPTITKEKNMEHTNSPFAITEERVELNKDNVATEESNTQSKSNKETLETVSIASQKEVHEKENENNSHTKDVKGHLSEDERLNTLDDNKYSFAECNNKLQLQLVATRSINKNDKLLFPPFVLDLSELESYV